MIDYTSSCCETVTILNILECSTAKRMASTKRNEACVQLPMRSPGLETGESRNVIHSLRKSVIACCQGLLTIVCSADLQESIN